MKSLLIAAMLAAVGQVPQTPPVQPQDKAAQRTIQVQQAEIYRRGDCVQEMGVTRAAGDDLLNDALAPPEDDSHKWFIQLVGTKGCEPCVKLKNEFEAGELAAWIHDERDENGKVVGLAWAHFGYFDGADPKNQWRFENLGKLSYPTLIVQPPKNGEWGENSTVCVRIEGYQGDPKKVSQQIRTALKTYIAKASAAGKIKHAGPNSGIRSLVEREGVRRGATGGVKVIGGDNIGAGGASQKVTIPPAPDSPSLEDYVAAVPEAKLPWLLQMKAQGVQPAIAKMFWDSEQKAAVPPPAPVQPAPPAIVEPIEPHPTQPPAGGILELLVGGVAATLLIQLIHFGLRVWDMYRINLRAQGKTPVVSDEIKAIIESLVNAKIAPSPKA
jgi:hypothetical protein